MCQKFIRQATASFCHFSSPSKAFLMLNMKSLASLVCSLPLSNSLSQVGKLPVPRLGNSPSKENTPSGIEYKSQLYKICLLLDSLHDYLTIVVLQMTSMNLGPLMMMFFSEVLLKIFDIFCPLMECLLLSSLPFKK